VRFAVSRVLFLRSDGLSQILQWSLNPSATLAAEQDGYILLKSRRER
jgi:hypothetical protein